MDASGASGRRDGLPRGAPIHIGRRQTFITSQDPFGCDLPLVTRLSALKKLSLLPQLQCNNTRQVAILGGGVTRVSPPPAVADGPTDRWQVRRYSSDGPAVGMATARSGRQQGHPKSAVQRCARAPGT